MRSPMTTCYCKPPARFLTGCSRHSPKRLPPMQTTDICALPPAESIKYTLWQLVLYFLRLGTQGFGGPVALVGYMHRDLVEQRGWITEPDYKEGIALAQLAPGPMAAQTAIYLGYVHYRILGAT